MRGRPVSHSILIHRLFEPPRALWSSVPGEEESIALSVIDGHTYHCAARLNWGDGECECGLFEREEINSTISFTSGVVSGDGRTSAFIPDDEDRSVLWDADQGGFLE